MEVTTDKGLKHLSHKENCGYRRGACRPQGAGKMVNILAGTGQVTHGRVHIVSIRLNGEVGW